MLLSSFLIMYIPFQTWKNAKKQKTKNLFSNIFTITVYYHVVCFQFFLKFYLALLLGMWALSSLTRD